MYVLCFIATCLQAGQVVANTELVDWNHRAYYGCPRQPLLCSCNHHIHLCRDGNAAFWTPVRDLFREGSAWMALPGLPAFFYDHLPGAVRRVDRLDVELHTSQCHLHLHSFLSAHDDHWKSSCKQCNFLFMCILIALGSYVRGWSVLHLVHLGKGCQIMQVPSWG